VVCGDRLALYDETGIKAGEGEHALTVDVHHAGAALAGTAANFVRLSFSFFAQAPTGGGLSGALTLTACVGWTRNLIAISNPCAG